MLSRCTATLMRRLGHITRLRCTATGMRHRGPTTPLQCTVTHAVNPTPAITAVVIMLLRLLITGVEAMCPPTFTMRHEVMPVPSIIAEESGVLVGDAGRKAIRPAMAVVALQPVAGLIENTCTGRAMIGSTRLALTLATGDQDQFHVSKFVVSRPWTAASAR